MFGIYRRETFLPGRRIHLPSGVS